MTIVFDAELAMKMYKERKEKNKGAGIDNSKLPAGSSMYYYCEFCGEHTQTVPEGYWGKIKTICTPCETLHVHGLI